MDCSKQTNTTLERHFMPLQISGSQVAPTIDFHDSVTNLWTPVESPNSDRMRRSFDTVVSKAYSVVTVYNNVARVFPPQTGQMGLQSNVAKDANGAWPGFFVYQQ